MGKFTDWTDSLVGTLIIGTGGSGSSDAAVLFLLLENFRAWPKLPLRRRRLEKDFLRPMAGSSLCSTGVCGCEAADDAGEV